jgi:hypothetical protein
MPFNDVDADRLDGSDDSGSCFQAHLFGGPGGDQRQQGKAAIDFKAAERPVERHPRDYPFPRIQLPRGSSWWRISPWSRRSGQTTSRPAQLRLIKTGLPSLGTTPLIAQPVYFTYFLRASGSLFTSFVCAGKTGGCPLASMIFTPSGPIRKATQVIAISIRGKFFGMVTP